MRDHDPKRKNPKDKIDDSGVSRRDFLRISGISVAIPLVAGPKVVLAAGQEIPVHGPGKVAMEFIINGEKYKASLEPRVTLLDALRDQFELTGAKRVCDRGECGACTVLMDNYKMQDPDSSDREGASVFYKDAKGNIFHTYSTYARGIDMVNTAYHYLDLVPKGRDEGDQGPSWLRRHDEYGD